MDSDASAESVHIRGLAFFAGFGFAAGFGLIFALERVGAPDQLVTALGPLLALATLAVIGAAARAPNIMDFLTARRAMPAIYSGLAFAAVALGLLFCLGSGAAEGHALPWRGAIVGIVAAALLAGPRWRFENASALSDVLASYFPSAPTRALFAIAAAAAGFATAIAGFALAAKTLQVALNIGPAAAVALCAFALAISIAPGGLKSVLWSDAASGGGALLVLSLAAALSIHDTAEPTARISAFTAAVEASEGSGVAAEIAAAFATAALFAFAPSALATASTREAARAGSLGLLFLAIGAVLYATAADAPIVRPSQRAMAATVAWLPAMALARAGILAVSRAGGLDLSRARARLAVLASRRIALTRASGLAATALCAFVALREGAEPDRALYVAFAIVVAFIAPALLLTLVSGRSSRSALAALGAAAVVAMLYVLSYGAPTDGSGLLAAALLAGALGAIAGLGAILTFSSPEFARPARSDPFVDLPLDAAPAPVTPEASRAQSDASARRQPR